MTSVSVLMPVRNGSRFLHRALSSTLTALGPTDELLVFDDGSTDETPAVLSRFSDDRLHVVRVENGVGIGQGLNTLLGIANGKFIARMDADDVCLPWRFRLQLRQLERSGSDAVFGGAIYFGSRLIPYPVHWSNLSARKFQRQLLHTCPGIHPTLFAHRRTFDSGFRYTSQPQEDLDLWLRLSIAGKTFSRFWIPVIGYRRHSKQVSRTSQHLEWQAKDSRLIVLRGDLKKLIFPSEK